MKTVNANEVANIKLLLKKGLSTAEICNITGRSDTTVGRVRNGKYDYMETPEKSANLEITALFEQVLDLLAKIETKL